MQKIPYFVVSAAMILAVYGYAADPHKKTDSHAGHGAAAGHGVHWGYTGAESPEKWGDLDASYALCKTGQNQSPIDLTAAVPTALDPIALSYQATPLRLVNNGHTIQVNTASDNAITVGGKTYTLAQFHFHSPSEHIVNGQYADMEIHFVHKNDAGQLAVIGVLLQKGAHNPVLQTLLDHMPTEEHQENVPQGVSLQVGQLFPQDQHYYHYSGSLTTPPCSEGVRWFVMQTHMEVSKEQLSQFVSVMHHNARPVQSLHKRVLLEKQ